MAPGALSLDGQEYGEWDAASRLLHKVTIVLALPHLVGEPRADLLETIADGGRAGAVLFGVLRLLPPLRVKFTTLRCALVTTLS